MTDTATPPNVTADGMTTLMQNAGYRVTRATRPALVVGQPEVVILQSASRRIPFDLRFGNPGEHPGQYVDYTLASVRAIGSALPIAVVASLVAKWNVERRFTRLWINNGFLGLEMDVIAIDASARYLTATIEVWDHLLGDLEAFLNNAMRLAVSPADAAAASASSPDDRPAEDGDTSGDKDAAAQAKT